MFLYYVPEGTEIQECKLGYALDLAPGISRVEPYHRDVLRNGPDGKQGRVYTYGEDVGYYPDRQHWAEMHDSPAWIGWPHELPPDAPALLARTKQLPGSQVALGDDSLWTVPLARKPVLDEDSELRWTITLPRSLEFRGGEWLYGSVERRFARLHDLAWNWVRARVGGEVGPEGWVEIEIETSTAVSWAVEVLGFNYRLGPHEASVLQIINQFNFQHVLDACCEWQQLVELLEKKT